MLHWLAGKPPDPESMDAKVSPAWQHWITSSADPDGTINFEPPETPAPVFAMRAFRHAIFGTPDTAQSKPRRHSNTEGTRPRQYDLKPTRPNMTRPKSAGDAQGLGRDDDPLVPEVVNSPTKGILVTPGTPAARRKTVSFGDGVVDNEDKRPIKSGLPDDCPGKFPSPFTNVGINDESPEEPLDKGRGRTKLTEELENARDESAKRKRKHRNAKEDGEDDGPKQCAEPKSESGKYWKAQYDNYRENSQREMKKLITKQKAAKSFARDKDFMCTNLADELRQEKKKVDRLEKRTTELEAQLKEMRAEMQRQAVGEPNRGRLETVRSQPELVAQQEPAKPIDPKQGMSAATQSLSSLRDGHHKAETKVPGYLRDQQETAQEAERAKLTVEAHNAKHKPRPEDLRTKSNDDIWAESFGSSGLLRTKTERPPGWPSNGRTVTSGTRLTPLKSLSINTLPTEQTGRRDSAQPSPPAERSSRPDFIRHDSKPSPRRDAKFEALPLLSPSLPRAFPGPRSPVHGQERTTLDLRKHQQQQHHEGIEPDGRASNSESSPLQLNALLPPPPPRPGSARTLNSQRSNTGSLARRKRISRLRRSHQTSLQNLPSNPPRLGLPSVLQASAKALPAWLAETVKKLRGVVLRQLKPE